MAAEQLVELKAQTASAVEAIFEASQGHPLYVEAAIMTATWHDPAGMAAVLALYLSREQPLSHRVRAIAALVAARSESLPVATLAPRSAAPVA